MAALPRLQVLRIKMQYLGEAPYTPLPIDYPLSGSMVQEREVMTLMKKENCPNLYEVWMHPEHGWTYVAADHRWVPKQLVIWL